MGMADLFVMQLCAILFLDAECDSMHVQAICTLKLLVFSNLFPTIPVWYHVRFRTQQRNMAEICILIFLVQV